MFAREGDYEVTSFHRVVTFRVRLSGRGGVCECALREGEVLTRLARQFVAT